MVHLGMIGNPVAAHIDEPFGFFSCVRRRFEDTVYHLCLRSIKDLLRNFSVESCLKGPASSRVRPKQLRPLTGPRRLPSNGRFVCELDPRSPAFLDAFDEAVVFEAIQRVPDGPLGEVHAL